MRKTSSPALLLLWCLLAFSGLFFHEPWRDEAQAWLVAKSIQGPVDLLLRASAEGTGPFYYLMLWPWAKLFPGAFPLAIQCVSFMGAFGASIMIVKNFKASWIPVALILFSFPFGYEYPVVARLYGWGSFLFLWGAWEEERRRNKRAACLQFLACLVQLSFVFPVLAWRFYKTDKKTLFSVENLGAVTGIFLSLILLGLGSSLRPWHEPALSSVSFSKIGTTVGHIILPGAWSLGATGVFIFAAAILLLDKKGRLALLLGALPFVILFSAVYGGRAFARQGAPLFLLWLLFSRSVQPKGNRVFLQTALALSVFGALGMYFLDYERNYSDGVPLARAVLKNRPLDRPLVLYGESDMSGFVTAAKLDTDLYVGKNRVAFPFFKSKVNQRREKSDYPTDCQNVFVVFVGTSLDSAPPLPPNCEWRKFYSGTPTIIPTESYSGFFMERKT